MRFSGNKNFWASLIAKTKNYLQLVEKNENSRQDMFRKTTKNHFQKHFPIMDNFLENVKILLSIFSKCENLMI